MNLASASCSFTVTLDRKEYMVRVARKRRGKTFVMNVPWWDAIFIKQ